MASKIRIFRSTGATAPSSLEYGELAITVEDGTAGTQANKAGRLFIGNTGGNPVEIGGEYTYKLLDHVPGQLHNLSAALVDSNGQIDGWSVAGILTATRTSITDLVTTNLNVTGVSTFAGNFGLNGNVTIGDDAADTLTVNATAGFNTSVTISDNLTVTGVATVGILTVTGNGNVDGSLYVGGLEVSGGAVIGADITTRNFKATGISTFEGVAQFNSTIDVDGQAIFDDVTVSAAATFTGAVDMNGGLDVSGGETVLSSATVSDLTAGRVVLAGTSGALEDSGNLTFGAPGLVVGAGGVNVTGVSTFNNNVDFSGTIDVDGQAIFDDITVSAAATVSGATQLIGQVTLGSGGTKYTIPTADGSANQALVTNGTGSVTFQDISTDLNIAGDTGTDTVSLLTDTLTFSGTTNEIVTAVTNNTVTVSLPDDVIVGASLTVTSNLLVLGNLTVEGTETIINVERLDVQDKTIGVASTSTANNTTANGGGFFVHGGGDGDKTIFWSLGQSGFEVNQDWLPETDDTFSLGNASREWKNLFVDGLAEFDDVNVSAAATINTLNVTGTGTIATADINGGNIDGTVIGAASSAAATLTTVNYTSLTGGNITAAGSRVTAGDVTFTNLRVTGVSTVASLFLSTGTNTNGVAYFDASGQVTSTATPSAGIQTSNFILTTNASGVPSWTDTIDGGQF